MIVCGDPVITMVEDYNNVRIESRLAVGVGWESDGIIISGCAFNNFSGRDMEGHIAHRPGHIMSPAFIVAIMDYSFVKANVERVTARVWKENRHSQKFVERLGFVKEGEVKYFKDGNHLLIYGLYQEQAVARWLTAPYLAHIGVSHGKIITESSPHA